jgi:hypothetical protein
MLGAMATQEPESRRITVQVQPEQKASETLSQQKQAECHSLTLARQLLLPLSHSISHSLTMDAEPFLQSTLCLTISESPVALLSLI